MKQHHLIHLHRHLYLHAALGGCNGECYLAYDVHGLLFFLNQYNNCLIAHRKYEEKNERIE